VYRSRPVSLALVLLGTGWFVSATAACSDATGPQGGSQGIQLEVEGVVQDSRRSNPIPQAHVWVRTGANSAQGQLEAWTDDQGHYLLRFRVKFCPSSMAGPWINAIAGSYGVYEKPVSCRERQTVNFRLSPI
jgi:hypothetical protein